MRLVLGTTIKYSGKDSFEAFVFIFSEHEFSVSRYCPVVSNAQQRATLCIVICVKVKMGLDFIRCDSYSVKHGHNCHHGIH